MSKEIKPGDKVLINGGVLGEVVVYDTEANVFKYITRENNSINTVTSHVTTDRVEHAGPGLHVQLSDSLDVAKAESKTIADPRVETHAEGEARTGTHAPVKRGPGRPPKDAA